MRRVQRQKALMPQTMPQLRSLCCDSFGYWFIFITFFRQGSLGLLGADMWLSMNDMCCDVGVVWWVAHGLVNVLMKVLALQGLCGSVVGGAADTTPLSPCLRDSAVPTGH